MRGEKHATTLYGLKVVSASEPSRAVDITEASLRRAFACLIFACLSLLSGLATAQEPSHASDDAPILATPIPAPPASPTPTASTPPTAPPTSTLAPIFIDPPFPIVAVGRSLIAHLSNAIGHIDVTIANPALVAVTFNQDDRSLKIEGLAQGSTTFDVRDENGTVRTVTVRVAYPAGTIPADVHLRITGNPASQSFIREAIAAAIGRAVSLRPGARITTLFSRLDVGDALAPDDRRELRVGVEAAGEGYVNASAIVRIHLENFALPHIPAARLFVSDYPERLTDNGVLFTAPLDRSAAQRFMYYHYNPPGSPTRRILVKVTNPSSATASLHTIASLGGPGLNDMEVGHLATKGFLEREARNEGTVVEIPAHTSINLVVQDLPPGGIVNSLFQLREVHGEALSVAVVAQFYEDPLDRSVDDSRLLSGGAIHARGVYAVPHIFGTFAYDVDGPNLEIPIGHIPLPNLVNGQALAGDYGVSFTFDVVVTNSSLQAMPIALYANPRGGTATGTFLINATVVQAHKLNPFEKFKLWQQTIPPQSSFHLTITTIPEGGSSYPLRLIFGRDDGSVVPGAPTSPMY